MFKRPPLINQIVPETSLFPVVLDAQLDAYGRNVTFAFQNYIHLDFMLVGKMYINVRTITYNMYFYAPNN